MTAAPDAARYARLKDLHLELDELPEAARAQRLRELDGEDPDLARALRRRFEGSGRPLDILDRAERQERDAGAPQLPHYRIVRELGRGGMAIRDRWQRPAPSRYPGDRLRRSCSR